MALTHEEDKILQNIEFYLKILAEDKLKQKEILAVGQQLYEIQKASGREFREDLKTKFEKVLEIEE